MIDRLGVENNEGTGGSRHHAGRILKENIINLNEQQIEKLKLKVPQLWRFYRYETCITRLFRLWIAQ
jgi:hypothetical protein